MTDIFWGDSLVGQQKRPGTGKLVVRGGETFYKISNYDSMTPFFMTVVSGFDHWMFVSSTGGLTCGRGNSDHALFPYYTDDKIHDAASSTGPIAVFLVHKSDRVSLWKPFSREVDVYRVERNLYKNQSGNKLIFEEINHDLGLSFSYQWSNSKRFGFIKTSRLHNISEHDLSVKILDGLRNILPSGVTSQLQTDVSTLVDAYKRSESLPAQSLALYSMSSTITDRAEPSEALRATVAWCNGLEDPVILLSDDQLSSFSHGLPVSHESMKKGKRAGFFVQSAIELKAGKEKSWILLADVDQDPIRISELLNLIGQGISAETIERDIEAGSQRLSRLIGAADGWQLSSDTLVNSRHCSNTLFNIMRGGILYDEYQFPKDDFLSFVGLWNRPLVAKFENLLDIPDTSISLPTILKAVKACGDADMERLVLEYLPLTFSRRHGDPSRPWNQFSIDIKNEDGSDKLYYQGNWRDIFQNWEALMLSYPEFSESIISKFVNASTADGYNPYRITKSGFEWEVMEPDNPWSNIGYWGDHQINYLLKLVELSSRYHPDSLGNYLSCNIFVYADVPYRIKKYHSLLEDPRNSVFYDDTRDREIALRVRNEGSDGKLLRLPDGSIYRVNLLEKILVTMLTKLGNLVPDGGIWMNTQRPEWNDANNALTGYGLSMVTLCYLRRFLVFFADLLNDKTPELFDVSVEVLSLFSAIERVFGDNTLLLDNTISAGQRKLFVDQLGLISEQYRESVYPGFSGNKSALEKPRLLAFIGLARTYLETSIDNNRRKDGLFSAYNLIRINDDGYAVEHLGEMLEGQVAVLDSAYLSAGESLDLLDTLRSSHMYRADQNSYTLYPDKELPRFLENNVINAAMVELSPWIQNELRSGNTEFVQKDINGIVHFNSCFRNADELRRGLESKGRSTPQEQNALCDLYETVFNHHQFTGRSGAMFKYEGLGCIYWHMVSKLLLVTADTIHRATRDNADQRVISRLLDHFDNIKGGLGLHKSPEQYGAFPIDPYSHTTGFSGVQQPGMTGQVKEDVITRFTELGVTVNKGEVSFRPLMLKPEEFISRPHKWVYSVGGKPQTEQLDAGCLAFCLCGVTVIYRLAESNEIQVHLHDGNTISITGNRLDQALSQSIFRREKNIQKIVVSLSPESLRPEAHVLQ